MPIPNVSFWCEAVLVPTSAINLFALIQATFAANSRSATIIDSQCSTFQVTADSGNATSIYVGDSTLNATSSPIKGVGAELAAGQGFFMPTEGAGRSTNNINPLWVQAVSGTPYLLIRCWQQT